MFGLHLSRFLLATGVVAAFLPLPAPMVESEQTTIVEYVASQDYSHEAVADKQQPSAVVTEKKRTHAHTAYRMGMPFVLTGGTATSGELFSALAKRAGSSKFIVPAPVIAVGERESEPEKEQREEIDPPIIGKANRIVVPSVSIDIGVQPGAYDVASSSWHVDDSSAFHAGTTVPVNDSNGTTLIYGHAKWGIFGALPDVQTGAEASVYTIEGTRFVYSLELVKQVEPSDVSMLTAEGSPKLILQTCSGLFDQHRTLAVFALKGVA